jgi:hypothetical protein
MRVIERRSQLIIFYSADSAEPVEQDEPSSPEDRTWSWSNISGRRGSGTGKSTSSLEQELSWSWADRVADHETDSDERRCSLEHERDWSWSTGPDKRRRSILSVFSWSW